MSKEQLWKTLSHLSDRQLAVIEKITNKTGIIDKIDSDKLRSFIKQTDLRSLDVSGRPVCMIDTLDWDFPFFTFYFFNNIVANVVYCLYKGWVPYINYIAPNRGINLWEEFMEQPYSIPSEVSTKSQKYMKMRYKFAPINFPDFPTEADISLMGNLYSFFIPNKVTNDYFCDEYQRLIEGKRVLGVLCRGTDYTNSWIAGLPKQPTAEELISIVKMKMGQLDCEYIYLATEEKSAFEKFCAAFPGKVIQNKRFYYDEQYYEKRGDENNHILISAIRNNRPNDDHYKYLEYLSSINILSKCNALIAGTCGGSRAALYLNNGKYEYYKLIDKGLY